MKLLLVSRSFPPDTRSAAGAVFRGLWQQARVAHDVRLITGYRRDRAAVPSEALGVDLRELPAGWVHWALRRAVSLEVRRFSPDVVVTCSVELPMTGLPTVALIEERDLVSPGADTIGRLRTRYYRSCARRLDAFVVPTLSVRDALTAWGIDQRRVHVVPNAVDASFFRCEPRAEVGEPWNLLVPGRILPGKGQHVAIDAVARLPRADKDRVRLWIVGAVADAIYYDQLRIQAYNQPVRFVTDVEDLATWYARADLVLFPSMLSEAFGLVAVEAMAAGRPVCWAEQPSVREATGGIGFPVPSDDAVAMREQITAFLRDSTPFREAGKRGRELAMSRYAWERVWPQIERILEDVGRG